jgi:hypothetical protein
MGIGLSKAAEPALILPPQQDVGAGTCPAHQLVSMFFLIG